jgi:hypothetical protein
MQIVTQYGTMWARNAENIARIPRTSEGGLGVYILFDGSMPMYVGKGKIKWRIIGASTSERRGQLWDHFSWYAIKNSAMMHALTRQGGNFKNAKPIRQDKHGRKADPITRIAGPKQ